MSRDTQHTQHPHRVVVIETPTIALALLQDGELILWPGVRRLVVRVPLDNPAG